uniref:Uncharacterized protein n=1 Tax=Brassica oleracea TaxID=3712 RepID=A0A3P6GAR2_BRAOL|nr:unnamed protein product [Brassica oleracea]
MYIQTRMAEYAEELWELLKKKDNTFVYMCGLKGTFNSFHFLGETNQVSAVHGWGI